MQKIVQWKIVQLPIVLRKKWENGKKIVKLKVSSENKYVKGTGSGPSLLSTSYSEAGNQIVSLINIQATGNAPLVDCDADSGKSKNIIIYIQFSKF